VVDLPAYFLDNQRGDITMLLPEIHFSKSTYQIEDFIPKSIKSREIVGKLYTFGFLRKIKV
jgi:hypothetical protein